MYSIAHASNDSTSQVHQQVLRVGVIDSRTSTAGRIVTCMRPIRYYLVSVQRGVAEWIVARRFSEFHRLCRNLAMAYPNVEVPTPPPKAFLRTHRVLSERQRTLDRLVQLIAADPTLRCDEEVEAFFEIQTARTHSPKRKVGSALGSRGDSPPRGSLAQTYPPPKPAASCSPFLNDSFNTVSSNDGPPSTRSGITIDEIFVRQKIMLLEAAQMSVLLELFDARGNEGTGRAFLTLEADSCLTSIITEQALEQRDFLRKEESFGRISIYTTMECAAYHRQRLLVERMTLMEMEYEARKHMRAEEVDARAAIKEVILRTRGYAKSLSSIQTRTKRGSVVVQQLRFSLPTNDVPKPGSDVNVDPPPVTVLYPDFGEHAVFSPRKGPLRISFKVANEEKAKQTTSDALRRYGTKLAARFLVSVVLDVVDVTDRRTSFGVVLCGRTRCTRARRYIYVRGSRCRMFRRKLLLFR
eukprot:PhM_4_TR10812/c0_g1_i1/m.63377